MIIKNWLRKYWKMSPGSPLQMSQTISCRSFISTPWSMGIKMKVNLKMASPSSVTNLDRGSCHHRRDVINNVWWGEKREKWKSSYRDLAWSRAVGQFRSQSNEQRRARKINDLRIRLLVHFPNVLFRHLLERALDYHKKALDDFPRLTAETGKRPEGQRNKRQEQKKK